MNGVPLKILADHFKGKKEERVRDDPAYMECNGAVALWKRLEHDLGGYVCNLQLRGFLEKKKKNKKLFSRYGGMSSLSCRKSGDASVVCVRL